MILHSAVERSGDRTADITLLNFEVNKLGTANVIEAKRLRSRDAAFICMTTN
jgi:hypothetical protein